MRVALVAGWSLFTGPSLLLAGGGPENVFLLVNANSENSKTIANHYIELRKIPPSNVMYVNWTGSPGETSAVTFRDQLLFPVINTIISRRLVPQIDYLVYSSDFPWRVNLHPLFPNEKFPERFEGYASVTGATFLAPFIAATKSEIVAPGVNWFVPGPHQINQPRCEELVNVQSRGFRSRYIWRPDGNRTNVPAEGQQYMLSTMLGITRGRGNTVEEVISYLKRSASADYTRPSGTIYFMWNKDIRSSTRDKCFESVAADINRLGVRAKVMQGRVPTGAKDVVGMMVGAADFDLAKSEIAILPGAICEHLTSMGGVMTPGASQTSLSEFLRHGAAGASGTVFEPWSIQAKFPLPSVQLHYVRGCSLAEAFYQSVSGPYQLLIVGDPLCQPWAVPPRVAAEGIKAGDVVKGTIELKPMGTAGARHQMGTFEIFVDGRLVATQMVAGKSLSLDTTKLADGYHEIRVVGANADPIETQGRQIVPIRVDNHWAELELKVTPATGASIPGKFVVNVSQKGATTINIRQNSRVVASVKGESGQVEIEATAVGRGPVVLQAFSEGVVAAVSKPVRIQVK